MTTDEQILWLCEHGFTLPEGLWRTPQNLWVLGQSQPQRAVAAIDDELAYDLCAAHFARENEAMGWRVFNLYSAADVIAVEQAAYDYVAALRVGNSAAAIDALYRAVKGSQ